MRNAALKVGIVARVAHPDLLHMHCRGRASGATQTSVPMCVRTRAVRGTSTPHFGPPLFGGRQAPNAPAACKAPSIEE